jgi:hypothetical protein
MIPSIRVLLAPFAVLIRLDGSALASGACACRIEAGSFVGQKKLVLAFSPVTTHRSVRPGASDLSGCSNNRRLS